MAMSSSLSFLGLIAIILGPTHHVSAGSDAFAGNVTFLTPDSFDNFLHQQQLVGRPFLLMLHVDWCKICQKSFPKFEAAGVMVRDRGIQMDFAHADCTRDKTLCTRFGVTGYPSIKLFPSSADKEVREFRGTRTEQAFFKYAEHMTGPAVQRMRGQKEFDKVLQNETFAGFVAALPKDGRIPQALSNVAERWMDRHVFAVTEEPAQWPALKAAFGTHGATLTALSLGVQQYGALPGVNIYKGSLEDEDALGEWVDKHRFPGVWALDDVNFFEFTHANRTTAVLAFEPEKATKAINTTIRSVYQTMSDDFIIGILNGTHWAEELSDFGIHKQDFPRVLVTEDNFAHWVEDIEDLRVESLEKDLQRVKDGTPALLRQGRDMFSRAMYWKREAWRFGLQASEFAKQGRKEAIMVFGAVAVSTVLLVASIWCCMNCNWALFSDDWPQEEPIRTKKFQ